MYGRPRFAKRSIRDGEKGKIAATYPDFESGTRLLSLMDPARQDLIADKTLCVALQGVANPVKTNPFL